MFLLMNRGNYLINLENVILTPHLGSYASEGKLQMEIDAVNNLLKFLEDEYKIWNNRFGKMEKLERMLLNP